MGRKGGHCTGNNPDEGEDVDEPAGDRNKYWDFKLGLPNY